MNNIEKIKERLNIVDVVGAYIKLEKSGSNFKACCPFHNEKTPSFFASPDRGTYKCFGCGEGGDIFSFVEKFEGVDFKGSLKILAEKAGVELQKENPTKVNEKNRIYSILEKTTLFFEKNLREKKTVLEYLQNRGITEKTIKQFRLGFAEDGWQNLYDFLKKEGYADGEMEKAGLVKKKERGTGFYDRFRNRIIFPLFDNSGRPIAFSGRFFENDKQNNDKVASVKQETNSIGQAKYLNSPETILFEKSNVLYALNFAKSEIRQQDFSVLVEGQMDLLMCHQTGFTNAVAVSGTAFTEGHIKLLKRLSDKVVFAFDSDKAGFASACRAAKLALSKGMEVSLVSMPNGLDPADFILQDKNAWQEALKKANHIIDFYLDKLIDEIKDKRKLGKEVQEKILPFVSVLESEIEKANFVEDIANKLGVPNEIIWLELNKIKTDLPVNTKHKDWDNELTEKKDKKNKKQNILKQIAGLYWWQKGVKNSIVDLQDFEKKILKNVGENVWKKIKNLPEKIKNEIIFEAEIFCENMENTSKKSSVANENLTEQINELFANLEMELLNEKMREIMSEQKEAHIKGDAEKSEEKFKLYNKLSKQRDKLGG
ncbi:MAG: DNA primase [Patescibacteria group bacterium]